MAGLDIDLGSNQWRPLASAITREVRAQAGVEINTPRAPLRDNFWPEDADLYSATPLRELPSSTRDLVTDIPHGAVAPNTQVGQVFEMIRGAHVSLMEADNTLRQEPHDRAELLAAASAWRKMAATYAQLRGL
jgi:hypothetical protein